MAPNVLPLARGEHEMKHRILVGAAALLLCGSAFPQENDSKSGKAPIYRVTVVERTMKAINYQYRKGPTVVDFRGTVLLPKAKGEAIVESKRGRTQIDVQLEHFTSPQIFGREYLTYVLWAITPDGGPRNIGEIIPNSGDKASLTVTTDLQAFGMIVTAEPYSAVRQPSDVVVAENQVRSDTVGTIEELEAKYELLPRGQYTWRIPDERDRELANQPKVSLHKYEAISELYQAQNAVGVAGQAGAEKYAPNTYARARQLLQQAQELNGSKSDSSVVVQTAREAAEVAEDARVIAERQQQAQQLAQAQFQADAERRSKAEAQAEALRAKAEASNAQTVANAEREARQRAEADAAAIRANADARVANADARAKEAIAQAGAVQPVIQRQQQEEQKSELRRRLLEQLNGVVGTQDTPRGLVVTVSDNRFTGAALQADADIPLMRLSQILASQPALAVRVEGYSDSDGAEALSSQRAAAVRDVLVRSGIPSSRVSAQGFGASRPLASNGSASGRRENRRVEIVISGDVIGNLPFWDHTYKLTGQ
jgi:outer membrane protein OmpA-like peptidoglycan-associated protein